MNNIVTNLCAKFNDDRLWNEKALVHWKSDNNNPKNNKMNNVDGAWGMIIISHSDHARKTRRRQAVQRYFDIPVGLSIISSCHHSPDGTIVASDLAAYSGIWRILRQKVNVDQRMTNNYHWNEHRLDGLADKMRIQIFG